MSLSWRFLLPDPTSTRDTQAWFLLLAVLYQSYRLSIPSYLLLPRYFIFLIVQSLFFLSCTWHFVRFAAGWYLRRKTTDRRRLLEKRVAIEQDDYDSSREKKQKGNNAQSLPPPQTDQKGEDDDDWKKVECHMTNSTTNGGPLDKDWKGIVGFFHPFCNAGGGGERVLWSAIRATQKRYPDAICCVYTGDHNVSKTEMIQRVHERFNIQLHAPTLVPLYLSTRHWVLASTWPRFTLLGQSLGSLVLAWDAFSLLVPDVFVDTMGYAFALALSKWLFPDVPTGAYVHYPTISTDMLDAIAAPPVPSPSSDPSPLTKSNTAAPSDHVKAQAQAQTKSEQQLNQSKGSVGGIHVGQGAGLRGKAKRIYWRAFAALYGAVGGTVDVVMTNSSWTRGHIEALWGPARARRRQTSSRRKALRTQTSGKDRENRGEAEGEDHEQVLSPRSVDVVFPPVAVTDLLRAVDVSAASEARRETVLLYIAQFRPEKNHSLILHAFAELLTQWPAFEARPRLVLVGSVRGDDDSMRVYNLRLLAHELHVRDDVEFVTDAAWPVVQGWLGRAKVGVNAMWNEHFGIGVVEYQAAGLISVVHDSGGPKKDIVVEVDGGPTGFHATDPPSFARGFGAALDLSPADALAMRLRARASSRRFTEEAFEMKWVAHMETLTALQEELRAAK
ncbi:hypothetical protein BDY21DRAFT_332146 [Lineolata rhizophorae]|uniref:GDP-Man:Man(3)GlcNAc(2)-PP-Dol alpha-1,2-mannosyltransferase n=1 Tax=Lineolata rhizophorae TaxID=578093 RepID=A0A6A6PDE9_9PEZI|nr:hypothetical protein BDY21DRAFT_332146 [Lineolata rhizophorae]